MIFKWGEYAHDQAEIGVRVEYQSVFDGFKRRHGEIIRFTLIGVKRGSSQADLTDKLQALFTAYQSDYKDFGLYLDDGTTPTQHVVTNASTFGGTKVVAGPNFINGPWSGQPEYANQRTYSIVLQAETRIGTGVYAWRERIRIQGTGASKWRYSPQMVGDPQLQVLQTNTSFWYIQEGSAVGHDDYVAPPGPLYPGIEHGDMRVISYETPAEQRFGSSPRMPATQWKYMMEATVSQGFSAFVLPSLGGF